MVELLLEKHRRRIASGGITTGDVALALNISSATVKRWADGGRLVSHRSGGGHRLYDVADVAQVLSGLLDPHPAPNDRPEVLAGASRLGVSSMP